MILLLLLLCGHTSNLTSFRPIQFWVVQFCQIFARNSPFVDLSFAEDTHLLIWFDWFDLIDLIWFDLIDCKLEVCGFPFPFYAQCLPSWDGGWQIFDQNKRNEFKNKKCSTRNRCFWQRIFCRNCCRAINSQSLDRCDSIGKASGKKKRGAYSIDEKF